jgi:hypothetical protein
MIQRSSGQAFVVLTGVSDDPQPWSTKRRRVELREEVLDSPDAHGHRHRARLGRHRVAAERLPQRGRDPIGIMVLSLVIAALVSVGATFGEASCSSTASTSRPPATTPPGTNRNRTCSPASTPPRASRDQAAVAVRQAGSEPVARQPHPRTPAQRHPRSTCRKTPSRA